MKTKAEIKLSWTCPKCGRRFERKGQAHSCRSYPIEKQFEGKWESKLLYEKLKQAVKQHIGSFKTESLECCIHFVSTFTFAAVKIFKNKIRVDFSLNRKLRNKRIERYVQMSANRYLYLVNILADEQIDAELMEWIQEAHDKKSVVNQAGQLPI